MRGRGGFSPERLKLARQRRGIQQQELAVWIGVTPKAVSRWELGKRVPITDRLESLSRVLNFPVEYFFGSPPPILQNWAFRSLTKMTAPQRDMALAAGVQAISLDMWLDERIQRPELRVPDLRGQLPEAAATAVRATWGLGYRALPNVVHLMEANGFRVYSLVHDGVNVDAFSVWHGNVPFVFLNTTVTIERSRMDACHEIGHLVLHARTGGGGRSPEEREAAEFATALLMPAEPVMATAPPRVTLQSIVEAKQLWGVSALAYICRLHKLGRITEWQYRSLAIKIKTEYRTTEPHPLRVPEASKVLWWVFSSRESGISRREAVRHLQVPMSDLDEMIFGLTLTPVRGKITGSAAGAMKTRGEAELRLVD